MAARHLQGIVAADRRVVFVHGQLLAQFEVEIVVDVELHAAGQRRPRHLLFRVPGVGRDRFVRLDVRGVADVGHRHAETGVAGKSLLLQLGPGGPFEITGQAHHVPH